MSVAPGSRFGPYEVVSSLGAGGMGEVYRARDSRLHRDVAIKILPDAFAADPERLARFEREAQILASLNHPHIAQIYGVERAGAHGQALVMELVDGETLADRIARGPLPVAEAVAIAKQVADALGAAHDVGIVHRDLKPANIRVRPDGTVKLLDFGLARSVGSAAGAASSAYDAALSPTITSPALTTGLGTLLGTAVYMAPEQAKGRTADKRADVWAFGCVLFEMLAGRRAFDGESVTETLAAVLMKEPDWNALPPPVPRHVTRLIQRCLRKDPRQRLQDVGDARLELEEAGGEDAPPPVQSRSRGALSWSLAIVAAAALGAAATWVLVRPAPPASRTTRFEMALPAVESAVLSPDGSRMVIASQRRLFVRELGTVDLRALEGTEGAVRPFWSPDGGTIAYGARGKLWKVPAAGGTPVAICDLVGGLWDDDAGGVWRQDDTIVYSDGNTGLFQVAAQGGDPVVALKPDPDTELHFHALSGLPEGGGVIYAVHRGGAIQATDTIAMWSGGTAQVLLQMPGQDLENPVYSRTGHILFERAPTNAGVWAVPFSASSGLVTGEPFLVAARMRQPSVSADGTLATLPPRRQRRVGLAIAGRDGQVLSRIDEPRLRLTNATFSPDGGRIAVTESTEATADVWVYDLARGARLRVTRNGTAANVAWSGDGRSVFYDVRLAARAGVQIKRALADGSERTEDVVEGRGPIISSDGSTLFYVEQGGDGLRLWYRSLKDPDGKPRQFIDQAFYTMSHALSPDGAFVAYAAATTPGPTEIYLRRFPPSEGVWQVSTNGGTSPRWSADGRLFFARGADVFEVTVTTAPEVRVSPPLRLFTRSSSAGAVPAAFDVAPDGTRFLIYEPVAEAGDVRLVVTLNWPADVKR